MCNADQTDGQWTEYESHRYINEFETLAALFALPPFYFSVTNCHVNIYIDDITPVALVNSIAIFGSQ